MMPFETYHQNRKESDNTSTLFLFLGLTTSIFFFQFLQTISVLQSPMSQKPTPCVVNCFPLPTKPIAFQSRPKNSAIQSRITEIVYGHNSQPSSKILHRIAESGKSKAGD